MELNTDLSAEAVSDALGERPFHFYPAIVSTEADALAWARAGAPEGAVVVADYQISLRGWAGRPFPSRPGEGVAFSMVLRPKIPPVRAGWMYIVGATALADIIGGELAFLWPDEVYSDGQRVGQVVNQVQSGVAGLDFCSLSVMMADAAPPRGVVLSRLVGAVEERYRAHAEDVLADYRPRCLTLGHRICASFFPLGPRSKQVVGTTVDISPSGALVVEVEPGRKLPLHVQDVGKVEFLEDPEPVS